jgi:hypothetical protein
MTLSVCVSACQIDYSPSEDLALVLTATMILFIIAWRSRLPRIRVTAAQASLPR